MPTQLFTAEIRFARLVKNGVACTFLIIGKYLKIFIFY